MTHARRKPDDETGVRKAIGSRSARERMVRTSPDGVSTGLGIVPTPQKAFVGRDASNEWLGVSKPDAELRFPGYDGKAAIDIWSLPPAVALSAFVHAALLAFALLVFPDPAELAAGGETVIPIEVLFVAPDSTDAAAVDEGAKPDAVTVSVPLADDTAAPLTLTLPEVSIQPPVEQSQEPLQIPTQAEPAASTPEAVVPPTASEEPVPVVAEPADTQSLPTKSLPTEIRRNKSADHTKRQPVLAARQAKQEAKKETQQQGENGAGTDRRTQQALKNGGASQGAAATAGKSEIASYRSRILAHLARFKDYPDSAQDAGIQGRTIISFTVTRSGGVSTSTLTGSSGAGVLDQATLTMLRRAQPFPAMPAGGPASLSITAVIRYDLR